MSLYDFFNYLGFAALIVFNLTRAREQRSSLGSLSQALRSRFSSASQSSALRRTLSGAAFWAVAELLILSCVQYAPAVFLNQPFGELVGTGANYFASLYLLPLFLAAGCSFLGQDFFATTERITPALPLALSFAKLGCFFGGCCGGITITLPSGPAFAFPIQLLESAVAALLFAALLYFRETLPPGTHFPAYLISYSAIRFFTEFLRHEEAEFLIFKRYHLFCAIGVALGLLEWYLVRKYPEKVKKFFT